MGDAKRDSNYITTILGVSSADGLTPVTIYVDPTTHRVLVSGDVNFTENEVPSGTINGSNVTFTVANAPSPATSLKVYLNSLRQVPTTDYTLSGVTITFVQAPLTGSTLLVDYRY